jgi:hypothetical protein
MRLPMLLLWVSLPVFAGTIQGTVVDALAGGPVAGARVRVAIPGAEAIYAMADDGGQFLVNNLKAGPYALIVQGRGYLESRVMAAVPEAGAANLRIALTRYAVIAGRVTDSEGYPEISTVVRTFAKRHDEQRLAFGGRARRVPLRAAGSRSLLPGCQGESGSWRTRHLLSRGDRRSIRAAPDGGGGPGTACRTADRARWRRHRRGSHHRSGRPAGRSLPVMRVVEGENAPVTLTLR